MYINHLGLENFRVFEKAEFDFKPITILTGANNSGKSSVFKALLLLKKTFEKEDYPQNLDFMKGKHNLGDFDNTIFNKQTDRDLFFTIPFPFFNEKDIFIKLGYKKNKNSKYKPYVFFIDIYRVDEGKQCHILQIELTEENNPDPENISELAEIYFDIIWFKEPLMKLLESKVKPSKSTGYGNFTSDMIIQGVPNFSPSKNNWDEFHKIIHDQSIYFDFEEAYADLPKLFGEKELPENDFNQIKDFLDNLDKPVDYNRFWEYQQPESFSIKEIYDYCITSKDETWHKLLSPIFKKIFDGAFEATANYFKNRLSYLELIRVSNERLYRSEGNALNQILDEIGELNIKSEDWIITNFANYWIQQFGIGEFTKIEILNEPSFELNGIFLLTEKKEKKRTHIIDLGFGTIQLITIILKIVVEAKKNYVEDETGHNTIEPYYRPHTILIEEPEANLHPNWQAMLADLFLDAGQKFSTQFILETHSEYLFRQFQHWVSFEKLDKNDITVFYINKQIENNQKIIKVDISSDEKIEDLLGIDFFNYAERQRKRQIEDREAYLLEKQLKDITKPFLIFEGESDSIIFEVAYESIFKRKIAEDFSIMQHLKDNKGTSIGAGSLAINNFLFNHLGKIKHNNIFIAVFDFDKQGLDDFFALGKKTDYKIFSDVSSIYGFNNIIQHNTFQNVFAITLVPPSFRTGFYDYDEAKYCHITTELLLQDTEIQLDNRDYPSKNDKSIFGFKGGKVAFAKKIKNEFENSKSIDFSGFNPTLELIKKIIEYPSSL